MPKTRFAYDTEFLEDGKTIDLISIAIVREDGKEYYAVNSQMPIHRIRKHEWLMAHVVPFLPMKYVDIAHSNTTVPVPDTLDPSVKPHRTIAKEVYEFLTAGEHDPELWAHCASYDHVVFAQLWGVMAQLPKPMPMRTRDVADALDTFDAWKDRPFQDPETAHDARADARHVMETLKYIEQIAAPLWILEKAQDLREKGILP
jgi:hypothetical protein